MKFLFFCGVVLSCLTTQRKHCYWPDTKSFRLYSKEVTSCPWEKCRALLTEFDIKDCLKRNQAECVFIRKIGHECLSIESPNFGSHQCRREHEINFLYQSLFPAAYFVNRTVTDVNQWLIVGIPNRRECLYFDFKNFIEAALECEDHFLRKPHEYCFEREQFRYLD